MGQHRPPSYSSNKVQVRRVLVTLAAVAAMLPAQPTRLTAASEAPAVSCKLEDARHDLDLDARGDSSMTSVRSVKRFSSRGRAVDLGQCEFEGPPMSRLAGSSHTSLSVSAEPWFFFDWGFVLGRRLVSHTRCLPAPRPPPFWLGGGSASPFWPWVCRCPLTKHCCCCYCCCSSHYAGTLSLLSVFS